MEIQGAGGPGKPMGLTKVKKEGDNTTFREVLQAKVERSAPAASVRGTNPKSAMLAQGEKVLELLDDFAGALADPHKSLRDMAPLVQKIEGEVGFLEPGAGDAEGRDRSLARLASEISLLANVTLVKFHRGDFIG